VYFGYPQISVPFLRMSRGLLPAGLFSICNVLVTLY
jgi:hypothetical protein